MTKSANDAASALAEMLGGDEDRFGQMMTLRARALGMAHTIFRNASGLPDPDQITTARDLAVLGRHLRHRFPGYYGYFSVPSFVFHGRVILNHDRMLQTYPGADGMKTGWIEASGHNLVTSAVHSGVRLIGVVLGAGSNGERDMHMAALLDQAFDRMDVPSEDHRTLQIAASRMPAFIPSAQAASLTLPGAGRNESCGSSAVPAAPELRSRHGGACRWDRSRPTKERGRLAYAARKFADGGEVRVELISIHGRAAGARRSAASPPGKLKAPAPHGPQEGCLFHPPLPNWASSPAAEPSSSSDRQHGAASLPCRPSLAIGLCVAHVPAARE